MESCRCRTSLRTAWLVGVALLLAGCASAGPQAGTSTSTPGATATPSPTATPIPTPTATATPSAAATPSPTEESAMVPAELLEQLTADVATRSGVDAAAVRVVSAQARTFPDGSLGCPQPGQQYTQALVDGYQVVLEAQGRSYDYRASQRGGFRLCEPGVRRRP